MLPATALLQVQNISERQLDVVTNNKHCGCSWVTRDSAYEPFCKVCRIVAVHPRAGLGMNPQPETTTEYWDGGNKTKIKTSFFFLSYLDIAVTRELQSFETTEVHEQHALSRSWAWVLRMLLRLKRLVSDEGAFSKSRPRNVLAR